MNTRRIAAAALIVLSFAGTAGAQARAAAPPDDAGVTPVELRRLLDAYSIVQAQESLKLSDDQYARFLPRFKGLLDTRRQTLQQHTRVLNVLRRLLMDAQPDESMLKDALKQLQEIDTRGEADARRAYDAIDQVLDLKQQAKFRVFEEQMERRKLELVAQAQAKARQLNRQNRQEQKLP